MIALGTVPVAMVGRTAFLDIGTGLGRAHMFSMACVFG